MKGTDGTYSPVYGVKEDAYARSRYDAWLRITTGARLCAHPQGGGPSGR